MSASMVSWYIAVVGQFLCFKNLWFIGNGVTVRHTAQGGRVVHQPSGWLIGWRLIGWWLIAADRLAADRLIGWRLIGWWLIAADRLAADRLIGWRLIG
jgi:hypothetical protein